MSATLPDSRVGYSHPLPFDSVLWKYVSHQSGHEESHTRKDASKPAMESPRRKIHKGKAYEHPAPVENSTTLRKEILMLSMNPSVWGNRYGVLGSS
jgi:hypothetical protein